MPSPITLKAPAKINLFLNLLGPRPDGFTEVRFVMQELTLTDTLTITLQDSGQGLSLTCSDPALAGSDNLVSRAYEVFYRATGLPPMPLAVHLEKVIPVQAGLGGGSSDAAAMLKALNSLHDAPLTHNKLTTLAAGLGSDVPFFLTGGTAIATGRGEMITPVKASLKAYDIVLLKPPFGLSTPEVFSWVKAHGVYQEQPFDAWREGLTQPDWDWPAHTHNDFESVVFERHGELLQACQAVREMGALAAHLSGSGPTLFVLLPELSSGECLARIHSYFTPLGWFVWKSAMAATMSRKKGINDTPVYRLS